jgi:hypothetical protein
VTQNAAAKHEDAHVEPSVLVGPATRLNGCGLVAEGFEYLRDGVPAQWSVPDRATEGIGDPVAMLGELLASAGADLLALPRCARRTAGSLLVVRGAARR